MACARQEFPSSSVVRASDRRSEGHAFNSLLGYQKDNSQEEFYRLNEPLSVLTTDFLGENLITKMKFLFTSSLLLQTCK